MDNEWVLVWDMSDDEIEFAMQETRRIVKENENADDPKVQALITEVKECFPSYVFS